MLKRIIHALAHWTQWNQGHVITWWEPDCVTGKLMAGFKCSGCGKVQGAHVVPNSISNPRLPGV